MTGPKKRAFPRVAPPEKRYASFPQGVAAIGDLSLGGVMLKDDEPLPVASPVRLNLHLGDETISCGGMVRWSARERGMGIQFVELSAENRQRLRRYVMRVGMENNRRRLDGALSAEAARMPSVRPRDRVEPAAAAPSTSSLGELLLQRGMISRDQLVMVTSQQRQHGRFAATLVRLGFLSGADLLTFVQREYRLPAVDLDSVEPMSEALRLVPPLVCRRYEIFPVGLAGSVLTIAVADPSNLAGLEETRVRTRCTLRIVLTAADALQQAIDRFYTEAEDGNRAFR